MLTTAEALAAVIAQAEQFTAERVASAAALDRVLRHAVCAERDQPPFDRVMMDGVALSFADYEPGKRAFEIQGTQAAGDPRQVLRRGRCIEIMTGASLPENADCIVPVERISVADNVATIDADFAVEPRRFIHARGSDYANGAQLLNSGKRVSPLDIAIIASCGETHVTVTKDPVIRVISTGNELIAAGEPIQDHQIRSSNAPAIIALLQANNFRNCSQDHIVDDVELLQSQLEQHLQDADVLVLSGGVSMGKADFVPQVLQACGVTPIFHKVSQRPGKPMWFGKGPSGQLVFGLPGNPVSAVVCCRQYVITALQKAIGQRDSAPEFASLASNVSFKPDLTCFQPVRLVSSASGQLLALPIKTNTSGDFAALSATDGYVELPKETSYFDSGTPVVLRRWIANR